MNDNNTIFVIVRQMLTFIGGFLVTKGILTNEILVDVVGAIMVLASAVWAIIQKRKQQVAVATALAMPEGSTHEELKTVIDETGGVKP